MTERITDPPSPGHVEETERLAGELLHGQQPPPPSRRYDDWPQPDLAALVRQQKGVILGILAERDAALADVARLAAERDALRAEAGRLNRLIEIPRAPAFTFADVKDAFSKGYDAGFEAAGKAAGLGPEGGHP